MKLTLQPGIKFVFPREDSAYQKLEKEFNYFTNAMSLFHNIEFEFHPESTIGWLPPYYVSGDPVWLENQYYRDRLRAHYRFCQRIILWDIGYPEVDYTEVKKLFYDKELVLVTDKLVETEYNTVRYDWSWNHFKYYATQDVQDPTKFWQYQDYHMPMLLAEKNIGNILKFDGGVSELRDLVFSDYSGQVTDGGDFIHTMVSVIEEPQLGLSTYHALSRGHLVMLYSAPFQVKKLGAKGFWLGDLFDFTYDQVLDDYNRLEQFCQCLRKFCMGTHKHALTEFYLDNINKLRANQALFFDNEYDNNIKDCFKT